MKHTWIKLTAAALALGCLLTGCGGEQAASSAPQESPGTFGVADMASAPAMEAETTQAPSQPEDMASDPEPAEEADPAMDPEALTELAVECAVAAIYHDRLTYDPGDPVYFWRALGYLLGHAGTISDGQVKIPTGDVGPYVAALFGEYTEQYPSLGEENPLVYEEDGVYTVSVLGPFDHSFTMTEIVPEDGGYSCHAEVSGSAGTAGYTVTLTDWAGDPEAGMRFRYSIASVTEDA